MANLKLNNVVVVTESAGTATVQSGIFKAKDGTAAFTIANSTGAVALSSNLTVAGDLTISGTTTTVDTALTVSDAMVINNAGSDVGLKINSTSTGNIIQLQDGGVDKFVIADGGNITAAGNLTIADGTNDLDVASHDGTNGLKLGGTLVTSSAAEINLLDGKTTLASEAGGGFKKNKHLSWVLGG